MGRASHFCTIMRCLLFARVYMRSASRAAQRGTAGEGLARVRSRTEACGAGLRNQVDGLERRSASSARRTARRDLTSARITKLAMPKAMRPSATLTERRNQAKAPSGSLRAAGSNRRANASKARAATAANHRHVIHAIPWPHFRPDVAMVKPASQGTFPSTGAPRTAIA